MIRNDYPCSLCSNNPLDDHVCDSCLEQLDVSDRSFFEIFEGLVWECSYPKTSPSVSG